MLRPRKLLNSSCYCPGVPGSVELAEISTLDVTAGKQPGTEAPPRVPALTILYHPDLARIGERARLGALAAPGGNTSVSRTDTEFAQPGAAQRAPLADPVLSRRGLRIDTLDPGHWRLTRG